MFKKIKVIVYSNILLSQILFFSLFALLGLTYQGSAESSIYILYLVMSSFLAYLLFFLELIKRVTLNPIIIYILSFSFVLLFFIFLAPDHSFVKSQTSKFFVLVLPAAFVGYIVARNNNLYIINKGFIVAGSMVFIGVLRVLPRLVNSSLIELLDVFGGGQYQAFSYFCAFSFLTFFRLFLSQNVLKVWQYFFFFFIIIVLFSGVILSGGRGGLIVLFVGFVVFIILKKGFLKFVKYFIYVFLIISFLSFIVSKIDFVYSDRIDVSFDRLFSFISSDGINMEGTSNRDDFYDKAISKISKSLIFGYGFFGLVDSMGEFYPHNIFLEVLLHGGLIYLVFFLIIMIVFFLKLLKLIKLKEGHDIILIPTIYSMFLLLVSGSYLEEPFFWFSITYVFSYPLIKIKTNKIENLNINIRISK